MHLFQRIVKRALDISVATTVLIGLGWLILLLSALARWETGVSGIFKQTRVGKDGKRFSLMKIRTMRPGLEMSTVTTRNDPRVTRFGASMRKLKLDELPQFLNVLKGDMSLVGPRPDVEGFADQLQGRDRLVLACRPGLTGPATLAFRVEEELLSRCEDPDEFNREVVYPIKTVINREYVERYSLKADFQYLAATLFPSLQARMGVPNFGTDVGHVLAWHREHCRGSGTPSSHPIQANVPFKNT